MEDLIRRKAAIDEINKLTYPSSLTDVKYVLTKLPSAEQNRIARETAGKSPDEIYDFLYWLMSDYGMQFTDSRAAVIEWLKGERR